MTTELKRYTIDWRIRDVAENPNGAFCYAEDVGEAITALSARIEELEAALRSAPEPDSLKGWEGFAHLIKYREWFQSSRAALGEQG